MKALWDELASYNEPLTCNYDSLKVVTDHKEKKKSYAVPYRTK
jgi:hypothetical protein